MGPATNCGKKDTKSAYRRIFFSGKILSKKVCVSDQMPQIGNEGGLPVIFYGDPSGLHCKITEDKTRRKRGRDLSGMMLFTSSGKNR